MPVFIFEIERSKVRQLIKNNEGSSESKSSPIAIIDRSWPDKLIREVLNRQESFTTTSRFNSQCGPIIKNSSESDKNTFLRYTNDIEDMYHRAFVRGIFNRLSDKIISPRDFQIALYVTI